MESNESNTIPPNISLNEQDDLCPYVRVGCTYYKRIKKRDRYGIIRTEYRPWKREELKLDNGNEYLKSIPHYDDFVMEPDNEEFKPEIDNCLNLYSEFPHIPLEGEWKWTEILLKHVFGDQYNLGLRYLQILYLHHKRSTVILTLISKERQTGKTTFLNWIQALFGGNVAPYLIFGFFKWF